jgi:hypothetical protein
MTELERGQNRDTRSDRGWTLQDPWEGLLKVQEFRSVWEKGTTMKFLEQLREEVSPDLTLVGEEGESRGMTVWTTGTKGRT